MPRDDRLHPYPQGAIQNNPDKRTPFERDHDRILHSYALRRLASVTQVVNPNEGRFFHNRLTHTLKVAQIARRIAQSICDDSDKRALADRLGGLDAEVVSAAALAHDLGHPPFGHVGERQLHECVSLISPVDGYEGNAQSFRIVNKLEIWRTKVVGLNLTQATLNALLKYPWFHPNAKHPQDIRNRKWGAYRTERDVFEWVMELREEYFGSKKYEGMTLEAAIMDWADDIAYATHDVEDFYRAGLIPLDKLFVDSFDIEGLGKEGFLDAVAKWRPEKDKDEIRAIFTELVKNFPVPIQQQYHGTREQQGRLRGFVSALIGRYVTRTEINEAAIGSPDEPPLKIPPEIHLEVKILKDLTRYYVINNRSLATQQEGEAHVIKGLFQLYFDASAENKESSILPIDFQELLSAEIKTAHDEINEKDLRARIVADMISSMTDDEALRMYQRLTGISLGSALERMPDGW